eukprot:TRINITY_DN23199_c0_g1_i1.p1 TRINITY_DN23199_c0_g1~~TRINITY_DN23199_c0_g1_i1.p1  ORF type:complete len:752 (+),score=217.36 TRINITY_DN23199_c0_g1_i1:75-2258(+)
MRAVHEGLGDQNVRVYTEAAAVASIIVPAFCGAVDGNLLVAHLAPLLRQLCSRMGDAKEIIRTHTTQALFKFLRPPTGNIVSPTVVAMLILRHLAPRAEAEGNNVAAADRRTATAWLCRLDALRDIAKEYPKSLVQKPGSTQPGEWLKLKDGLLHCDPTVRHESARLYALVCKLHLKVLGDEAEQMESREAWVAALPVAELPAKAVADVRKLLKLPEVPAGAEKKAEDAQQPSLLATASRLGATFEVTQAFANWSACEPQVLEALRSPQQGDEEAVHLALQQLNAASANAQYQQQRAVRPNGPAVSSPEEALANICRAIQQVLSSAVGGNRKVFLSAVELCHAAVSNLAPLLSGLDINMGLAKTLPIILERTSLSGSSDVKVGVAADKLVRHLAQHPKIGCEAATKMIIAAVAKADRPIRPLMLLGTLLQDFGLRLCAQRDVVQQLLHAVAAQLERMEGKDVDKDLFTLRPQLVKVLATVNQFSPETFQQALAEVDTKQRQLLLVALREAPDPRLVALGAAAAEQAALQSADSSALAAGSAAGALRRTRSKANLPSQDGSSSPNSKASTQELPEARLTRQSESQPQMRRTRTNGPLAPLDGSGKFGVMEVPPADPRLQRMGSTASMASTNRKRGEEKSEPFSAGSSMQKESPRFGDSWGKGSQGRPLGLSAALGAAPAGELWNAAESGLGSPLRKKIHRVSSEGSLVRREDSTLSSNRLNGGRQAAR